jgi:NADPH:quinone reductase-like Zn-dependent oxidoreductase
VRAVRFHEFGGVEQLRVEDVPEPSPGAGEVKVKVGACALNHLDVDLRQGISRFPIGLPHTSGLELAGEIVEVGPGVSDRWKVGDRVAPNLMGPDPLDHFARTGRDNLAASGFIGFTMPGGFAEYTTVPERHLVRTPDAMSDVDAAAFQIGVSTAYHMLFTRGELKPGETVLVNSVGSGVGSAAVQLARHAGAFVIGNASSDEKLARARELGMHEGINHATQDVAEEVRRLTDGRGVDLVFEHVGGKLFQAGLDSLVRDGRLVTCGAHSGEVVPLDIIPLFRNQTRIIGSFVYTSAEYEASLRLWELGAVKPIVHQTLPLEQIREAFELMEARGHFGKIVITP